MGGWRETVLAFSSVPDVRALLASAEAAFIWSRDGNRILWANPAGGALLGVMRFRAVWDRRWASGHTLRRTIANLARAMPKHGTLARLRLADDPRETPIACRCRFVRAAGERGILIVAAGGSAQRPSLHDLAAFLSDACTAAVILDAEDRVLAGGEADDTVEPAAASELHFGGRTLRLAFRDIAAEGAGAEAAADADFREASAGDAEPGRQHGGPAPRSREALHPPPEADTKSAPAETDRPALGAEALSAPPPEGDAPPQPLHPENRPPHSITAGRVPRQLSRKPVRFLWQTDAADRFLFVSPGLAQVVGRSAEIIGERFQDAAARLRLDPSGRIAGALKQHDTWSGHTAWWPVEGSNVRVPGELTALPVFGPDQSFQGYRGFGVLRPAEALMPAAFEARFGSDRGMARRADQVPPYEESIATEPANVVPIRTDLERMGDNQRLSPQERNAFEEIAEALRSRVTGEPASGKNRDAGGDNEAAAIAGKDMSPEADAVPPAPVVTLFPRSDDAPSKEEQEKRAEVPAEREPEAEAPAAPLHAGAAPSEAHQPIAPADRAQQAKPPAAGRQPPAPGAELSEARRQLREMTAILDTATDGVLVLDSAGVVESVNASAEALFGLDASEMLGRQFADLLTEDSGKSALDYLSGLRDSGVASLLNEGREVAARAGTGSIPIFMTMGRISSEEGGRFCAVLRDITHWKRTEAELMAAKRAAEEASGQKSEFLARVSHEIRTPLNAIIGFAEVMIEERFGPVENERYREYLRDIRTSGEHVVSLVNDLLDISKIEAGKLDLHFAAVPLNEVVRESIGLMQPQASRAHVVLRSSLSGDVPAIVADERTLRQIVLNILSNAVKFTGPGGQVIASTSLAETGEALIRVRDTGDGMSEDELARALEPFRQLATATMSHPSGTGLGLPLTKALVEANRASLSIKSARGEGTVVTVTFPPTRVLSE